MSEYYVMSGDLMLAINQLELALSVPSLTDVQRARFMSRLKELREALPPRSRGAQQPQSSSGGRSPNG
jgi:hypothetical protein